MDVAEATAGERDHDVLAAGAGVTMTTDREREQAPQKQKRWDALLKRPDLDYSDLFSDITGKLPGLTVWQIENFYPIEIDEGVHMLQTHVHETNAWWGQTSPRYLDSGCFKLVSALISSREYT